MKKNIQKLAILVFVFGIIFTTRAFAQLDGNPENFCRNGVFPRESKVYKMARITGKKGEKIYFYGDEREDCPDAKGCRLKSYLIPGDEIIVSRALGDYACGWFQPARGGETVGWIKTENLELLETNQNPAEENWLGEWRFYDNSIVISKSKTNGLIDITGDATWKGLGDNVHVGELDYEGKPDGSKLEIGENDDQKYGCKVAMQLVGRYLIVTDNLNCGGANVTFSGVYQRKAKK